jgi:competence protein ComEA
LLNFQRIFQEKNMRIERVRRHSKHSALALALSTILAVACTPRAGIAQLAGTPQPTVAQKIAASKDLLDINTATPEQLKALPGMGAAYAQRVIAGRPYTAKNQLTTRGILPADEYEKIKPRIVAHRVKH